MKVPSGLVIQDRKLTHYLLVYQAEDDKSEFLASAGYTLQNWQLLKRDRLKAMAVAEVAEVSLLAGALALRSKLSGMG